jgi:hypothetical protein
MRRRHRPVPGQLMLPFTAALGDLARALDGLEALGAIRPRPEADRRAGLSSA